MRRRAHFPSPSCEFQAQISNTQWCISLSQEVRENRGHFIPFTARVSPLRPRDFEAPISNFYSKIYTTGYTQFFRTFSFDIRSPLVTWQCHKSNINSFTSLNSSWMSVMWPSLCSSWKWTFKTLHSSVTLTRIGRGTWTNTCDIRTYSEHPFLKIFPTRQTSLYLIGCEGFVVVVQVDKSQGASWIQGENENNILPGVILLFSSN